MSTLCLTQCVTPLGKSWLRPRLFVAVFLMIQTVLRVNPGLCEEDFEGLHLSIRSLTRPYSAILAGSKYCTKTRHNAENFSQQNELERFTWFLVHYIITFYLRYTKDPWWPSIKTIFKGSENAHALFNLTVLVNHFGGKTKLDDFKVFFKLISCIYP